MNRVNLTDLLESRDDKTMIDGTYALREVASALAQAASLTRPAVA